MADHVVPHFHNDAGVPVIEIGSQEFMCVGANPPFDHPHVFLDLGNDKSIGFLGKLELVSQPILGVEFFKVHGHTFYTNETASAAIPGLNTIKPYTASMALKAITPSTIQ